MRQLILALASFFVFANTVEAGVPPDVQENKLRVAGDYPEVRSRFEFEIECITEIYQSDKRAFGPGSPGSDCRLTKVEGKINGKLVSAPKKAFTDIWNPRAINSSFSSKSRAVILHIVGGDGAESYDIALHFIDGRLRYRDVPVVNKDGEKVLKREHFPTR